MPYTIGTHRIEHQKSKLIAIMSMSLDGYVADLNDGLTEVFDWYFNSGVGVTHLRYPVGNV